MSTVYLHIGQAGCQVGDEFWNILLHETAIKDDNFFNRATNKMRGILVDSEPKVVTSILNNPVLEPTLSKSNVIFN